MGSTDKEYDIVDTSSVIRGQCISAVFAAINLYIVIKELRKRCRGEARFQSCSLKWLSLLSITGGLMLSFIRIIHFFDGLCIYLIHVETYISSAQPICVGLYQLSRLYECFATDTISKRYPKWLFCVMTTFGIFMLSAYIPLYAWSIRVLKCNLTRDYGYHITHDAYWGDEVTTAIETIGYSTYLIWDLAILMLLVFKLRSVTRSPRAKHVKIGIRRNLTRIIILTSCYTSVYAIAVIWHLIKLNMNIEFVPRSLFLFSPTTLSLAVFLMQPHNSEEYGAFLKGLISVKLHYCCCCYRNDVKAQRDHCAPRDKQHPSGVEMEAPVIVYEGTVFNQGSMDAPPSEQKQFEATLCPVMEHDFSVIEEYHPLNSSNSMDPQTTDSESGSESLIYPLSPLSNMFRFESAVTDQFSSNFSFGLYLDYWRQDRHNSVKPKYKTLKDELLRNKHSKITETQYQELRRKCVHILKQKQHSAQDVGIMNMICKMKPGTSMTLDHVIVVKFYTDFTKQQTIFKKQCRKVHRDDTTQSVIRRNREIAHWCRLLRECILFYGDTMSGKDVVYCGLDAPLIFKSLHQRFECPLSTTTDATVANQFVENEVTGHRGVILKLKRANPKTRYLNVAQFTQYHNESERLFMGSTLKIVDIIYENESLVHYISTLQLFEHIVRGQFLSANKSSRKMLLAVLRRVMEALDAKESTLNVQNVPEYVQNLFMSFLDEMKVKYKAGALWLNRHELERKEYRKIKEALLGDGKLFDLLGFDKENIPRVQQFEWTIDGEQYEIFRDLGVSQYRASKPFRYELDVDDNEKLEIPFHLRFYSKYNEDKAQCAIYLEIEEMPENVKELRIEADIKCKIFGEKTGKTKQNTKVFRQLLKTQILKRDHRVCGFQLFDHEELNGNESMEWMVGVKILRAEHFEYDEKEEYLRDLYQIFI